MREHESAPCFLVRGLENPPFGPACEGDEFPELDGDRHGFLAGMGIFDVTVRVIRIYYSAECLRRRQRDLD